MPSKWKRIIHGEGITGNYLVAFFNTLECKVWVGIGTCVDGEWRIGPFDSPIAYMNLPNPPPMKEFGLDHIEAEAKKEINEGGWLCAQRW